jgi:diguanylate cyclase (GGDEF)-like protein
MAGKRRRAKSHAAGRDAPLSRVLDQSERVEDLVEEASADLGDANVVLKQETTKGTPLHAVIGALEKSSDAELKVKEAAEELVVVNDALSEEIDARIAVEDELTQSKAALSVSRVQEKRARHEALHDDITGLPNATLFKDRLKTALAQARRHSWHVAVMFIDLDDFKQINDTHGHDVGDAVLRMVADRLKEFVRGGDTVSRRSGDEFLFLMLEAKDLDNARTMAQRIISVVAAPAVVNGIELSVQASVGLAMFPEDGTTVAALLKHADLAMYEAKRQPSGAVLPKAKGGGA